MRRNTTLLPALLGWVTVCGYDADLLACFYPGNWPIFSSALTDVVQRSRLEVEKGGTPGQPTLAEAGGKNPEGLRDALAAGKQAIADALK